MDFSAIMFSPIVKPGILLPDSRSYLEGKDLFSIKIDSNKALNLFTGRQ